MEVNAINKIQKWILDLLPEDHRDRPGILLKDSCSEVSRLVASWIKKENKSSRILILKGTNVCGTNKAHDILVIINYKNEVFIVDPTIWQFFPRANSILVFVADSLDVALNKIKVMYGGEWSINEESIQLNKNEEKNYLDIVFRNIRECLKEI